MRIVAIKNYNIASFKSCLRSYPKDYSVYPQSTKDILGITGADEERLKINSLASNHAPICTATNMFRSDLEWDTLMYIMDRNFKEKDKVNTYSLACSDGSEAYTFAISVLDKLGDYQKDKYLPILASDIDSEVIKAAQSGFINLSFRDFARFDRYLIFNKNYFEYAGKSMDIENNDKSDFYDYVCYKPIPKLKELVKFKQADILESLNNIEDEGNSVILCRNVMPYLGSLYVFEIAKNLKSLLKTGSLFVIGDYDAHSHIRDFLLNAKFEECKQNIFRKL